MKRAGFTLIELSIVLVIIGLIVGGVLVGRDLVRAAEVRATIAQIEKYNTAVNTFRGKYGSLPGDIDPNSATNFGLTPRGHCGGATPCNGEGDGNGIIEGVTSAGGGANNGFAQGAGETGLFWIDLSTANGLNVNLIDGSFSTAVPNAQPAGSPATTTSSPSISSIIGNFIPPAKLGGGNYVYVYSNNAVNYYGISVPTALNTNGNFRSNPGISVVEASKIDEKMDDGPPTTGNVTALYDDNFAAAAPVHTGTNAASCYDPTALTYNAGVAGGANVVCALSFRFQ